jgi:hypothetical protein
MRWPLLLILAGCDYGDSLAIVNDTGLTLHASIDFSERVGHVPSCDASEGVSGTHFDLDVPAGERLCFEGPIQGSEYDMRDLLAGVSFLRGTVECGFRSGAEVSSLFAKEGEYLFEVHVLHVDGALCP